jgi:Arylsulfotransferase (ASST)
VNKANLYLRRYLPWGGLAVVALSSGTLAVASGRIEKEQAAYGGPPARQCVPARLNVSAALPGSELAVSPLPDSRDASPRTQISMLGVPAYDIGKVTVTGSRSGRHNGRLEAYSQGDGASFVPSSSFDPGEVVHVRGHVDTGAGIRRFAYHFTVAYPDPIKYVPASPPPEAKPGEVQSFHSEPALHPPTVNVTYYSAQQQRSGDIFAAPYNGPGQTGPMIFEPNGQLVWMHPLPLGLFAANLQMQTLGGERVLSWWQGYVPPQGFGLGEEIIANSSYQPVMHIHAGNGYEADLHDFRIEPDDTAILTVFDTIHCNLTSVGGPRDGAVTDSLFQELDLKTALVRREWTSIDHVPLSASYASPDQSSAEWPFDYIHLNTVDPRADGTTLLSARNTWQLYLIDTRTGQVRTTVGGKQSSVRMEAGTMTAYQHDALTLPDGDISIFDNGGTPFSHPQSRALFIELNLQRGTDTKVFELTHPRALQAASQGNVQELPGGNWFVGWGAEPYFTEFGPSGQMIYDAHMAAPTQSYRAYKFEWSGAPTAPPSIATEAGSSGTTVYASWNGATEVASWQALGGSSPNQLRTLATVAKSGFETAIQIPREPYVEVQALDSAGAVIGHSATIKG